MHPCIMLARTLASTQDLLVMTGIHVLHGICEWLIFENERTMTDNKMVGTVILVRHVASGSSKISSTSFLYRYVQDMTIFHFVGCPKFAVNMYRKHRNSKQAMS